MQEFKIIDLTHTLTDTIPTWNGDCGFELEIRHDYEDSTPPDLFRLQKIKCIGGIGTHIDAPAHCIPGSKTIENLDMQNLVVDCVVIDVSTQIDEDYIIMPDVVEKFEKEYGEIKNNIFVIFYTGWDRHWETPEKYINKHIFPSVHVDTAKYLLEKDIAGIGTDTLSTDTGANGFPVHQAVLGAGKYLVENIANTKSLPRTGAKVLVLPMKIKDATEAPLRLVALV